MPQTSRWRTLGRTLIALGSLFGATVSTLALRVHYSTDTQPCDINAKWDCGIVNHSRFAMFHGVPVAVFGIVGYLVLFLLSFSRRPGLLFLASLAGCAYALYLTWIEAHLLEVWCLYCVISQVTIAALVVLSALLLLGRERTPRL